MQFDILLHEFSSVQIHSTDQQVVQVLCITHFNKSTAHVIPADFHSSVRTNPTKILPGKKGLSPHSQSH